MINIISLIDRELKPKKMGQVVCLVPRGDPDWIRTNDLLLRRQLLYPTELPDQKYFSKNQVQEPMTLAL